MKKSKPSPDKVKATPQVQTLLNEKPVLEPAYQRLLKISPGSYEALRLQNLGYRSAHQVAARSEREFVREYVDADTKNQANTAIRIYQNAVRMKSSVLFQWNYLRDLYSPHFRQIHRQRPGQQSPTALLPATSSPDASPDKPTPDSHESSGIPDYESLFPGSMLGKSTAGLSMYSPAAYLVDLMQVIDESITQANDIPPDLRLQNRRPDLWQIPLNTENTQTPITYINLLIEVLESSLPCPDGDSVYDPLKKAKYPFNMPFNDDDDMALVYLAKLGTTAETVRREMLAASGTDTSWQVAALQLSSQLKALVETDNSANIAPYYGFTSEEDLAKASIDAEANGSATAPYVFKVNDFCDWTGLSSPQLVRLITQRLSPTELRNKVNGYFYINQGDEGDSGLMPVILRNEIPFGQVAIKAPYPNFYIQIPSPFKAGSGNNYYPESTIGTWIKVTELKYKSNNVFYLGPGIPNDKSLGLVINDKNQAYFGAMVETIDFDTNGFDFTPYIGTWAYFTGTIDGNDDSGVRKISAYVNVTLKTSLQQLIETNTATWDCLFIARGEQEGVPSSFVGLVNTFRIWERLLGVDQITCSMNDLHTDSFRPDHQWNMQEGSGDTIEDTGTSDLSHSGTLKGGNNWIFDGLMNITDERLDRISRFVRLSNSLEIELVNLDILLNSLNLTDGDALKEDNLPYLGNALSLLKAFNLTTEALTSLWYTMPDFRKVDEDHPQDFFNQVYNNPTKKFSNNPFDPSASVKWTIQLEYTETDQGPSTDDDRTAQLCAALALSREDLFTVVAFISGKPPFVSSYTMLLNLANFTLLYRYALLGRMTQLSMPALCGLIALQGEKDTINTAGKGKDGIAAIQALTDTAAWIVKSNIDIASCATLAEDNEYARTRYAADHRAKIINLIAQFTNEIDSQKVNPESFVDNAIDQQLSTILFREFHEAGFVGLDGFIKGKYQQWGGYPGTVRRVPTDYQTIQDAIDWANDGDVILVDVKADGTAYTGEGNTNINVTKNVLITSAQGPANTIIDCQHQARAFVSDYNIQQSFTIDRFTIINGQPVEDQEEGGGAIWLKPGSAFGVNVWNCIFSNNRAPLGNGGAIRADGVDLDLVNCIFVANKSGGVPTSATGSMAPDGGGGGAINSNEITINRCTFWKNEATCKGGALYLNAGNFQIENSIFWDDSAPSAQVNANEIYSEQDLSTEDGSWIKNSSIKGYALPADADSNSAFGDSAGRMPGDQGQPNINEDPEFIDASSLRLIPSADSGCRSEHNDDLNQDITGCVPRWLLEPFCQGQLGVVSALTKDFFDVQIGLTEVITGYFFRSVIKSDQSTNDLLPYGTGIDELNQLPAMHREAFTVQAFSLSPTECSTWLYSPSLFTGSLNDAEDPKSILERMAALYDYRTCILAINDDSHKLLTFWKYQSTPDDAKGTNSTLAQITGWNVNDIAFLTRSGKPGFSYDNAVALSQMNACIDLSSSTGIPVDILFQIAGMKDADANLNENLPDLIRSNNESDWAQTSKGLSASISDAKRDALVPYAMTTLDSDVFPISTEDDLFAYLLLDPQMGTCMETSRIKQATLSLQLYVHRCRMNLEPCITDTDITETHWEWISNYRVWEANRKVFLYPENYMEPSLRGNKTPLFQELEDQLSGADITEGNVEKAYRQYLTGFSDISNLKIVGSYLYNQTTEGPPDAKTGAVVNSVIAFSRGIDPLYMESDSLTNFSKNLDGECSVDLLFLLQDPISSELRICRFMDGENRSSSWELVLIPNNRLTVHTFDDTSCYLITTDDDCLSVGKWHQISFVFNKDSLYADLYIDGAKATVDKTNGLSSWSGEEFTIARMDKDGPEYKFLLTELRIWNKKYKPNKKGEIRESIFRRLPEFYYKASGDMAGYWQCTPHERTIITLGNGFPSLLLTDETTGLVLSGSSPDGRPLPIVTTDFSPPIDSSRIPEEINHDDYTIYLIGTDRSAESGEFYYRSVRNMKIWQPWKKIDSNTATVNGDKMLPIFAFGKLFRFWLQIVKNQITPKTPEYFGIDATTTLYYSYLDFSNTWTAPTVVSQTTQEVVDTDISYFFDFKLYYDLINEQIVIDLLRWGVHSGIVITGDFRVVSFDSITPVATNSTSVRLEPRRKPTTLVATDSRVLLNNINGNLAGNSVLDSKGVEVRCDQVGNTANWVVFDNGFQTLLIAPTGDMKAPRTMAATSTVSVSADGKVITYETNPYQPDDNEKFAYWRLNTSAVTSLSSKLQTSGINGLLSYDAQSSAEYSFQDLEPVAGTYSDPIPTETIDFSLSSPMSFYYWEIFFFSVELIADQLNTNLKFNGAKRWLEYVYNPTEKDASAQPGPSSYWRFQGFSTPHTLFQELQERPDIQLAIYHEDPFDPFALAWFRTTAFMKNTVMAYIDNLIDYGDQQYRLNTRESINFATMLYILANDILGPAPQLTVGGAHKAETYEELQASYPTNDIPEFLIALESGAALGDGPEVVDSTALTIANYPYYFSLPENTELLKYWDTIRNRLHNIRHCLSLDGVPQNLPLFQPPIDPMQLVQASASGSLQSALNSPAAEILPYRFSVVIEKAKSLTQSVIQFGGSLLSALEKKDAEALSNLRASHEVTILNLTRQIKIDQVNEQVHQIDALNASATMAKSREDYYRKLIKDGLSTFELASLSLTELSHRLQDNAMGIKLTAAAAHLLPNTFGLATGGMDFGGAVDALASLGELTASIASQGAGLAATMGQYQRREQEWQFQDTLASLEIDQINAQIEAANNRLDVVQQEYNNLEVQINQAQEVEAFLADKFTNEQLYQWMISKLTTTYFTAYQLVYEFARLAERSYQYEQCNNKTFIDSGNWNSLNNGLLAGEGLLMDLNRLDSDYIRKDSRQLEIQKTISLKTLNPLAFHRFINDGLCEFSLDEIDFDQDFPGHYQRLIRSVTISIPAVIGPYQNLHATLIQLSNKVVLAPDMDTVTYLLGIGDSATPEPNTLRQDWRANEQIALSRGINDSGLFELNFNDSRYLPYEGTGAVSSWRLEMPKPNNANIRYKTITDVIITLNYDALPGGLKFRNDVMGLIAETPPGDVTQSYPGSDSNEVLTMSWSSQTSDRYNIKVVQQETQLIAGFFGPTNEGDSSHDFDIDKDLLPSKYGSTLISAVCTVGADGQLNSPFVYSSNSNYRLGQATIDSCSYDDTTGTLSGTWALPKTLEGIDDPQVEGYDYIILQGKKPIGSATRVNDNDEILSITIGLAPGEYQLLIRAVGKDTVIPGAWSEPQSFDVTLPLPEDV